MDVGRCVSKGVLTVRCHGPGGQAGTTRYLSQQPRQTGAPPVSRNRLPEVAQLECHIEVGVEPPQIDLIRKETQ